MCDIKFGKGLEASRIRHWRHHQIAYKALLSKPVLYIVVVSHATLKESLLERFDLRFSTFPAR